MLATSDCHVTINLSVPPNVVGGCCPRDLWVARDIILPYSLTYMRLMIEAVAFKAGRR